MTVMRARGEGERLARPNSVPVRQGFASGLQRPRSPFVSTVLSAIVAVACALPYAHEGVLERGTAGAMGMSMPGLPMQSMSAMPAMTAISAGAAHGLIAVKVGIVTALLLALGLRLARARGGALHRLAAAPPIRTALLVAAVAGGALAGFDQCSAFGGAGIDDSGACHCWVTAALCAFAALGTGLSVLMGRGIAGALARAIRAVGGAIRWLLRAIGEAAPLLPFERRLTLTFEAGLSSRLGAGRAPPV